VAVLQGDVESVRAGLLDKVRANPNEPLQVVLEDVARSTRTDVTRVTTVFWELVEDDKLEYGADAHVALG
jgi:hypothetical protein